MHLKERYMQGGEFLSTPSARRATLTLAVHFLSQINFYPRPPRGGRQNGKSSVSLISEFLSTPSARRATQAAEQVGFRGVISIHALREEGDAAARAERPAAGAISIHALREEGDVLM